MRVIGNSNRSNIEPDPVKAYHRGIKLDAMLRAAVPPIERGVTRGTHATFNRIDDSRRIRMARKINVA